MHGRAFNHHKNSMFMLCKHVNESKSHEFFTYCMCFDLESECASFPLLQFRERDHSDFPLSLARSSNGISRIRHTIRTSYRIHTAIYIVYEMIIINSSSYVFSFCFYFHKKKVSLALYCIIRKQIWATNERKLIDYLWKCIQLSLSQPCQA